MIVSLVTEDMIMPKYGAGQGGSEAQYSQKDGEEVIITS